MHFKPSFDYLELVERAQATSARRLRARSNTGLLGMEKGKEYAQGRKIDRFSAIVTLFDLEGQHTIRLIRIHFSRGTTFINAIFKLEKFFTPYGGTKT